MARCHSGIGAVPKRNTRARGVVLRRRRAVLSAWCAKALTRDADLGAGDMDQLAAAVAALERDISLHAVERRAEELADIDEALGRLARGRYGVCEDCGRAIGAKRLDLLPSATRCASCQRECERQADREAASEFTEWATEAPVEPMSTRLSLHTGRRL